jgi:hypothetical protein
MHTGRKHNYLGVDMEFCEDGALEVSMFKYLNNVIEDFLEIIRGRAAMPAHDKLFEIRDDKEAKNSSRTEKFQAVKRRNTSRLNSSSSRTE